MRIGNTLSNIQNFGIGFVTLNPDGVFAAPAKELLLQAAVDPNLVNDILRTASGIALSLLSKWLYDVYLDSAERRKERRLKKALKEEIIPVIEEKTTQPESLTITKKEDEK